MTQVTPETQATQATQATPATLFQREYVETANLNMVNSVMTETMCRLTDVILIADLKGSKRNQAADAPFFCSDCFIL
jgi:hypothetical protein